MGDFFDNYNFADNYQLGNSDNDFFSMYKKPYTDWNPRVPQQPQMDFMSMYNSLARQTPQMDASAYYDRNDPEVKDYMSIASQKPESENLLQSYIDSRPTREENKPGIGRYIASILAGMGSALSGDMGLVARNTGAILNSPYEDKLEDWKARGTDITTRARLLDAARGRELSAKRFGIENKYKSLKQSNLDNLSRSRLNKDLTGGATRDQNADEALGLRRLTEDANQRQDRFMNQYRLENDRERDQRNRELDQLRRESAERDKTRFDERNIVKGSNDPDEILKQRNASTKLAVQDAESVPMFKPILDAMKAAERLNRDPWEAIDASGADPNIISNFRDYIKSRTTKYGSRR